MREKNYPRFKPRNPLKSLDSDERIQGNPRQSNTHERGPSQRNGHELRKPNGPTGPMSWPAAEKEPNRLHPNAKRPSLDGHGSTSARKVHVSDRTPDCDRDCGRLE